MPRLTRLAAPAILLLAALGALLVALFFGGAADRLPLADPGGVVRFGLPIATLVTDLTAALAIGTLALTCFALTPERPEWGRALDIASAGSLCWTVASCVTGFFTFLSVSNVPVTPDAKFGESLAFFLTGTSLGLAWLVSTLLAAAVTVLCFAVRGVTPVFFVALLAAGALIPIAQQGHAAGTASHTAAVTALGLHIEGAAVWLGGLLGLVLLRPVIEKARLGPVLARYSSIALVCFVIVTVSGVASAEIRIGSWSEIGSKYGLLVIAKVVALIVLGLFGVVHRRVLIARLQNRLEASKPTFWWFVAAELGFLGLASGIAAALARTETPVAQQAVNDTAAVTPAEVLTDAVLPPEFTPLRWITAWNLDLVWLLACVFLVAVYVAGVVRLRRRGDSWPVSRTIRWCVGLALLAYVTCGAPNVYGSYLMSAHLVTVVVAGLVVPILLVPAAPWTMALLAIAKRTDRSRGPREWLLLIVQSRVAAWLTYPPVGGILLAFSFWAALFTPLLRFTATSALGHFVLVLGLLLCGLLFAQALAGVDPVPVTAGFGVRMGLAALVAAVVVALGAWLAVTQGLLLANWFGAMGREWGRRRWRISSRPAWCSASSEWWRARR
ncbi:ABC transporter permease [Frondihabitans sucicola]|uniref:ABC transporter permease n=1 Tax=Frondihabitans sucicola TaxID=1268041 RepID=A0ABM8GJ07_9MICO|nr:cytochrome c oxidase assembly protein [Frondihabitans sucicola]BDZ48358.1 ABC transporter permease [Frondihabitans sucicola]